MACLLLALSSASAMRLLPRLPARSPASPVMRATDEPMPSRHVRIVVHNAELLSARTATQTKQKQQQTSKGIESVSIGGTTIKFAHDMTTTFKWGGLILGLVLVKILRKGKYAWTEEPNFKYISRNAVEEAELHEFQCESCGFTIFPARGREGKFFPDDYRCQNCNAKKEAFFDMNDLSDPRTIAALEKDEDFEYEIEEIVVPVDDPEDEGGDDTPPTSNKAPPPPPPPTGTAKGKPDAPPPASPPATPPPPPDFDPLNNPLI
ncbi:hypothetical protein AB1Y20_017950 [Prymnesium parvum]|uniref:Rubredoxin-like domain-containing protein n=1 Tax=Prymnesium parvum TaxID=97485 RepID=A0AB34JNY6_PRYPA